MSTLPFSPLPLTTVFTPPSTCTSVTNAGTPGHYYREWNPSVTTGAWTSCYPPGFTHARTSDGGVQAYFSPGICPSGFTMCNSDCIAAYVGYWGISSSQETGGRCCLSNWIVVPYQGYCITTTSGTTITALGVEIRWKASDLLLYDDPNSPGMAEQHSTAVVPTSTLITTTNATSPRMAGPVSTTALPTMTVVTAATITISQPRDGNTRSLETGGETGLGVGLAILVLIIIASVIAFHLVRKRALKRRRTLDATTRGLANGSSASTGAAVYNGPMIELTAPSKRWKPEIDSNQLSELRAKSTLPKPKKKNPEVDSSTQLSELC